MRPVHLLAALMGVLLLLSGAVFTLQGLGIVGNESQFMFRNQAWVYQGMLIAAAGVAVVVIAAAWSRRGPLAEKEGSRQQ